MGPPEVLLLVLLLVVLATMASLEHSASLVVMAAVELASHAAAHATTRRHEGCLDSTARTSESVACIATVPREQGDRQGDRVQFVCVLALLAFSKHAVERLDRGHEAIGGRGRDRYERAAENLGLRAQRSEHGRHLRTSEPRRHGRRLLHTNLMLVEAVRR